MKKRQKVKTPHGEGVIVDIEDFKTKRYGVELKDNPFSFPIAYYFKDELKKQQTK